MVTGQRKSRLEKARDKFTTPESFEAALERRLLLVLEISDIDRQLSEPTRKKPDGNEMNFTEHTIWRRRAVAAKRIKEQELMILKRWLGTKSNQRLFDNAGVDLNDANSLIQASYKLFQKLHDRGVQFEEISEWSVVLALRTFLTS